MLGVLLLLSACQPDSGATPAASLPAASPTTAPAAEPTLKPSPEPSPAPTSLPTATPERSGTGNADVLHVRAVEAAAPAAGSEQGTTWTFHVTVQHPDTGWEDYADGWDVMTPDGTVLKPDPESAFTRLLLHPHVDEQPFTRSQSGIVVPPGITQVRVRAHDLVDGYGGREVVVDLTASSGEGFEVERQP